MARFSPGASPKPIKINKWLGVNEAVGLTDLKLGEVLSQVNYRITKDYKPEKRQAHKTYIDFENTKDVQGMWEGSLGGHNVIIACNNAKVYKIDIDTAPTKTKISEMITAGEAVEVGSITDAKTSVFYFGSKLYFINGTDYKEYNGTTYQDVTAYVPTIAINAPPAGGGTDYESINLLTGQKKMTFMADGVATVYYLRETSVTSIDTVKVDGVTKTLTTDYTVSTTNGTVTFVTAPADEAEVEITWTKTVSGHADLVKKNKYVATFGPGNDTCIFLWGNSTAKNRRSWSASLNPGYFPVYNFTLIGTDEYAITDIKTHNANYQIIFKEDRAYYSYSEYISATETYDYPVKDLNEKVGNITPNGVQIVNNCPISIKGKSWHKWYSTTVEDERAEDVISERLRNSLSAIDLATAITFDYQSEKEYWCNVGSTVYVWNYGNNTMYTFDNISGTCFLDIDGVVHYGSQGTIEKFGGLDDNGVAITAQIDTGFNAYGNMHMVKTSDIVYIGLLPDTRASVKVYFKTNKVNEFKLIRKKAEYNLLDFDDIDFDDYTFLTNQNPQTFGLEFSSGDYTYIQFRLENAEIDETSTILDFMVNAEETGEAR